MTFLVWSFSGFLTDTVNQSRAVFSGRKLPLSESSTLVWLSCSSLDPLSRWRATSTSSRLSSTPSRLC